MSDRSLRVLLIEAEEAHVERIRRAFDTHVSGMELTVATSLGEARDHLGDSAPDLILADWDLPDGKALELLPGHGEQPERPVVILTSHGRAQAAVDAMRAGALDYVVKSEAAFREMPHIVSRAFREWTHLCARKRAEATFRQAMHQARALLDAVPDLIFRRNRDGVVLDCRPPKDFPAYLPPEEVLGRNIRDMFPADVVEKSLRATERALETGQVQTIEYTLEVAGEERLYEARIVRSGPDETVSIVRDITEAKRAERALAESDARNRALLSAIPDLILRLDADGRFLEYWPPGEDFPYYIPPDELVGKRLTDVLPAELAEIAMKALRRTLRTGRTQSRELVLSAGDDVLHREYRLSPCGEGEALVIARDVTERKRAESGLQLTQFALDHAADPIYWVKKDGRISYANQAACRSLGYSREDLLSMSVPEIDPEFPGDQWPERWRAISEAGSSTFESRHRTRDGRVFPVEITTNYLEREGEGFVWAYVRDITQRKRAETELRESEARLRSYVDNALDILTVLDEEARVVFHSPSFERVVGFPVEDRLGRSSFELIHPEDGEKVQTAVRGALASPGSVFQETFRLRHAGGSWRLLESVGSAHRLPDGSCHVVVNSRDITERIAAEETARKLLRTVDQSIASVLITDVEGVIEYVNPRFTEMSGYAAEEAIGRNPRFLQSGNMPEQRYEELWETITRGETWRGELQNRAKDGHCYWIDATISPVHDAEGRITHFARTAHDITARKEAEARLLRQANYDELTGLPNRVLALDRLQRAVIRSRQSGRNGALLFIDLDNFQLVNDSLGHATGDAVLEGAAERLSASVRQSDTVARLGGDQFLIILTDLGTSDSVEAISEHILAAFETPFAREGHEFTLTLSIGIRLFGQREEDPHVLFREADTALYRAKAEGGNRYRFFKPEMNERLERRLSLESRLRHAVERGEVTLHYQPLIEAESRTIVAVEALLRWTNPDLGTVPPMRFVPVAEETGLILPIGEWVLRTACERAKRWADLAGGPRIEVNISYRQFLEGRPVDLVSRVLEQSGLPPDRLGLEITETLLIEDDPATVEALGGLSELGVHLSLDDFGKGYSALGYLKRFPFHTLKIDRVFVRDIPGNPADSALATAIIGMGHGLGLTVVGEGVETEEQLRFLVSRGCDILQGFYFSRPLPAEELEALLRRGRSLRPDSP